MFKFFENVVFEMQGVSFKFLDVLILGVGLIAIFYLANEIMRRPR
jgi:hypothetical protein